MRELGHRFVALVAVAVLSTFPAYAEPAPVTTESVRTPLDGGVARGASPFGGSEESTPRTITLAFTGDVLSHSRVTRQAAAYGTATADGGYDYRPMFAAVRPILAGADLAICHLQTPLSRDNSDLRSYPLFNVPFELAAALADAGYDGCSTAANHALDARADGVAATLDHLDQVGLGHAGTARDAREAAIPRLYDVQGVTIGHLSYTYGLNGLPLPVDQPWLANLIDANHILAQAHGIRAAGAEFVVLSMHWGIEYHSQPTAEQTALAHQLLPSADIDLIVGHHAHVVQPVEKIGAEYAIYGLGNFLSNQSAACCAAATQDGVIVEVRVSEGAQRGVFTSESVTFTPTWVDRRNYTIVPVAHTLAQPNLEPDLRVELETSWRRTMGVITALATPGLDPLTL
ncbi:MAG: CapA family protein [Egibacteraceae bacterium]